MKTPHVVALPFIYGVECIQFHALLASLKNVFRPSDLDLWPMTLTFKLDLDILPLDLHTEIQVCMSVRLAVRVVTHTQTHKRCQNYYTRHVTYVTWGVKKQSPPNIIISCGYTKRHFLGAQRYAIAYCVLGERSLLIVTGMGAEKFRNSRTLKNCPPPRHRRAKNLPPLQVRALKFCPPPIDTTYSN